VLPVIGQDSAAAPLPEDAGMPTAFILDRPNGAHRLDTMWLPKGWLKRPGSLPARAAAMLLRRVGQPTAELMLEPWRAPSRRPHAG